MNNNRPGPSRRQGRSQTPSPNRRSVINLATSSNHNAHIINLLNNSNSSTQWFSDHSGRNSPSRGRSANRRANSNGNITNENATTEFFKDPVSYERVLRKNGYALNGKMYDPRSLARMIRLHQRFVPLTMRPLTPAEIADIVRLDSRMRDRNVNTRPRARMSTGGGPQALPAVYFKRIMTRGRKIFRAYRRGIAVKVDQYMRGIRVWRNVLTTAVIHDFCKAVLGARPSRVDFSTDFAPPDVGHWVQVRLQRANGSVVQEFSRQAQSRRDFLQALRAQLPLNVVYLAA